MPLYSYQVLNTSGKKISGELTSSNEEQARQELEEQGFLIKTLRPKQRSLFALGASRVSADELLQCNQEMITLLKAGIPVPEVLDLVADRPESSLLSAALKRISMEVRSGVMLSEACAKYPKVFDGLYLSSLTTGEKTGNLVLPLARYQEHLKRQSDLSAKISQAMVYPIFLVGVLGLVLGMLFTFVMPRFISLYADFKTALPMPTRVLMFLVGHLYAGSILLVLLAVILTAVWKAWASTPAGRFSLDRIKADLPLLNRFQEPLLAARLARTLSTLLMAGTPLAEALRTARRSLDNLALAEKFDGVVGQVLEGKPLSKALKGTGIFSRNAIKLIEVGEASGQLEAMFQEIADTNERLLERRVQKAMTLIEPLFILVTGLLIGTVIVVMYLPILHLSDIVK